jgi:hypothetical protein
MKVIRGRGAASRTVVKDRPVFSEVGRKAKKGIDTAVNGLGHVRHMRYCEVGKGNGHRIGKDQILVAIEYGLLAVRKMRFTKETGTLVNIDGIYGGSGAREPSGVMQKTNRKAVTGNISRICLFEGFIGPTQLRPRNYLLGKEFQA